MSLLKRDSPRRRARRFDLDAAARDAEQSRFLDAFSSERLLDTLLAAFFCLAEVLVTTVGDADFGLEMLGGAFVIFSVTNLLLALFIAEHHRHEILDRRTRFVRIHIVTFAAIALARLFCIARWPPYLFPLGLMGLSLSIAFGQRFGIFWTMLVALIMGFRRELPAFDFPVAANLLAGTVLGILVLGPKVSKRRKVIRAGLASGLAVAVMILASELLLPGHAALVDRLGRHARETVLLLLFGVLNGLFSGYFLVEFGLRIIERAFDVVTDLRLQELADLNQPILKRFSIEASGTFHHSQMVGTLAEAAASAIGANTLLCRVGAHFHDIGKMAKPEYYIENVTAGAATKHDGLSPSMSTLIIVSHVKDGVDMAEELGLPQCVVDCIPEHHGTITVEYFYHAALKQQKIQGGAEVSRDDYRYPGPKPRSRETAILMIADSVEAISRVLTEPNPTRIEQMVHDVAMRRLTEGQFDECAITLLELKRVEEAMCRVLMGIFHGRIRYPRAATVDRPSEADAEVARANGEDTSGRLKLAALAADGPGVAKPSDATAPLPVPALSADETPRPGDKPPRRPPS